MRCLYSSKWRKRVLCGRHFGITEDGEKPIEEIQPGDYVWSWGEETGETQLQPVLKTYVNETNELVHVFVAGEEIVCTPNHPFYSPVKGWSEAVRLRAGDVLQTINGEYVVVEWVRHEILEEPLSVFNFRVVCSHTYYVSGVWVLVHNKCVRVRGGHGNPLHASRIDNTIDELELSDNYSIIYGNRALNAAGLKGSWRPDSIAFDVNGVLHFGEFASPSQVSGRGAQALQEKIELIKMINPGIVDHFIPW